MRKTSKHMASAEDYGDMHIDERPEDDNEETIDKYLHVELVMNMGTMMSYAAGTGWHTSQLIMHMLTNFLIPMNMRLSLQMGMHEKYQAKSLLKTCLHRLIVRTTNTYCCYKRSPTIRRTTL
jgi:hypothetical protein